MKNAYSFDDVLLMPQYSDLSSRKEADLTSALGDIRLSLPVIASPMDTVTEDRMAIELDRLGGIGIVHRYNSIEEQERLIHNCYTAGSRNIGAAIGVTGDFRKRAKTLVKAGANVICVDVAHGHHLMVKECLQELKELFSGFVHIMAGNVATLEAFDALAEWGADSIRVGIGGGSICSTRIQTGHGMPTLQSVLECACIPPAVKNIKYIEAWRR